MLRPLLLASAFALACVPAVPALAQDAAVEQVSHSRDRMVLTDGWRFRYGDAPASVTSAGFDDSEWESVSTPHTWNLIGEYSLTRSEATNNAQGIGWYRLSMAAPEAAPGMRQYLDFEAVGNIADVWVNGQHVGRHAGAFSRFRIDVTAAWRPGENNLIAVRADNSKPVPGSTTADVIPLAGDFFIHGGIYRPVSLLQLPAASIDPLDYGGPGVYARAAEITAERAVVDVRTRLRNAGGAGRYTLTTSVHDAQGEFVASEARDVDLATGWQDVTARVTFPKPRLWNGVEDPYLYTVTATLRQGESVLDSVTEPLGLRTIRFDADAGFFLNGEHVKMRGVSRHQDRLGKGWALSRADHAEDMAIIAEMGANSVRQAHYQHADAWTDEADKAGMLVWAELPYVAAPSLTGGKGTDALWANAEQQLRELIRQNFNNPSVVLWSIGNEVDSAKAFGVMEEDPSPIDLLRRMQDVAKQEDPATPTTFADFSEDLGSFGERRQQMTGVADTIAYNRYPGWYMMQGAIAGRVLGGMMDKLHAKHPTVPIGISEYGAGSGLTDFSDDPTGGYVAFAGRPQPEEYAAWVHEMLWPVIAERDYLYGSWVWNMFDFASDLRNEGDSVDINTKGLVSMDRKVKKDAFYYYQAAWSDEPVLHLTGKRYVERSYPVMDVKAYTNAPTARLTVNGVDLGEQACANFICQWQDVSLQPGANDAVVTAGRMTDSARWDGVDLAANGIRIDAGNLAKSVIGGKRYGSDTFVTGGKAIPRYAGAIGAQGAGGNVPVEAAMPGLYDYWRAGEAFSYAIPLPDGEWTVTIRTLEPGKPEVTPRTAELFGDSGAFKPVRMAVSANGTPAIAALDAGAEAGGERKGVVRSFPVTVSGGMLTLDFAGIDGGQAAVAAIEVTR